MKDERLLEMRVFEAVVEAGGFTQAAHGLGASQPFVSQTIQRLEKRLGCTLLHRTTRGHHLTPEGEGFLHAARRAIRAIEAAEAELLNGDEFTSGALRVSAPIAFGLDRITPLIPDFMSRFPQISLDLRLTDDTENLIENRIDVAIRMGRLPDSGLMHRRLCGLRRIVVAAPQLIAEHGVPNIPADLERFPCVAWDGSRDHLNRWNFIVGGTPFTFRAESRFRSNQGMSLYQMCLAGLGVMRVAEHLARPAIADGQLVQLLAPYTAPDDGSINAVFLPDRHLVPRIRVFIDFMVERFRSPPWGDSVARPDPRQGDGRI